MDEIKIGQVWVPKNKNALVARVHPSVTVLDVKQNPHKVFAYTFTLKDGTGPFSSISTVAGFLEHLECLSDPDLGMFPGRCVEVKTVNPQPANEDTALFDFAATFLGKADLTLVIPNTLDMYNVQLLRRDDGSLDLRGALKNLKEIAERY